jgi:hypothetical protein
MRLRQIERLAQVFRVWRREDNTPTSGLTRIEGFQVCRDDQGAPTSGRLTIAVRPEDVANPRAARKVAEEEAGGPEDLGRLTRFPS